MYTSGESVRHVYSEREAEVSRRLEMMKADPVRHSLGHGVTRGGTILPFPRVPTRYEAERQAETQLPLADLENGIRAAVRMYVSSIEMRGNLLVSDGFDNQVVVLRMGEDEAGDDDDDSREDDEGYDLGEDGLPVGLHGGHLGLDEWDDGQG
mgnify:FL=1